MASISDPQQEHLHPDDFLACIQHERWTRQQLEEYQARALQACREYAYAHSPFYQQFHQGLMGRPLQELPILTKALMLEHFDELVTDRAVHLRDIWQYLAQPDRTHQYLDQYLVTMTSGSSGQPGIFLYDPAEFAIETNSFMRTLSWAGITPQNRTAVVTVTAPDHRSAQVPITVGGQQVPRLQLSANDPLETLVQRLNAWQPDVLLAYSSISSALANEQLQGRLHISPQAIFCAADVLTHETRRRIEAAWQIKPFNVYGTTEGGALAAECEQHQGLHLFEDFSIVEIVDQNNQPVAAGQQGTKVLLTVPFRRIQPLIRYELTDLVRSAEKPNCACGRSFMCIEAVEGRATEVLYLPSPAGKEESVSALLFEFAIDPLPVSGWQVIQEQDGLHILLSGVTDDLREELVLDRVSQALTQRGVLIPPIEIRRVTMLKQNVNGKVPRLISHIPRQNPA